MCGDLSVDDQVSGIKVNDWKVASSLVKKWLVAIVEDEIDIVNLFRVALSSIKGVVNIHVYRSYNCI